MQEIWAKTALLESGWVDSVRLTIADDGRIALIEPNAAPSGHAVGVLLPAPANAHSHAFQRAMAGLSEARSPEGGSDSFWTWRKLMYGFLDQLDPEQVQAIAAFVQMEMAEAGYAANVEFHYLHHQADGQPYDQLSEMAGRIVAASQTSGLGLTLLPVLYEFGGCDGRALQGGQRRFGNDFERFARLHQEASALAAALPQDCRTGVAPHSLRAVRPDDLARTKALAGDNPWHMHLAEQIPEVEEVQAYLGARPVAWLLDNMALDSRSCLIHCTQMQPHETRGLAESGAIAGLCPLTESSLGDGIFDGVNWLAAGGQLALGSDSNIRISLSEELRTLEYSQRLRDHSRAALASPSRSTGRNLWHLACAGGALAAGRDAGALAVGCLADLVALDAEAPDLAAVVGDSLIDSFIFAGHDGMVTDLWSAGRHLVSQGRHKNRDAITAAYLKAVASLRGKL